MQRLGSKLYKAEEDTLPVLYKQLGCVYDTQRYQVWLLPWEVILLTGTAHEKFCGDKSTFWAKPSHLSLAPPFHLCIYASV